MSLPLKKAGNEQEKSATSIPYHQMIENVIERINPDGKGDEPENSEDLTQDQLVK